MRFLIDAALSPIVAQRLRSAGHDAVHVVDYDLLTAKDSVVFFRAAAEKRVLISADTDFPTLLALRQESKPSIVLLRRVPRSPAAQANLLLTNLAAVAEALEAGAVVVFDGAHIRIRRLPVQRAD